MFTPRNSTCTVTAFRRTLRFAESGTPASYFGAGAGWFSLVGGTITKHDSPKWLASFQNETYDTAQITPDQRITCFDVSLSTAVRVQLASKGWRAWRAMPKKILVADDNAMIRTALCRIFEVEQNYDLCAEAVNGEEAIALAREHKPDLIVLDFQMPVMNGVEAAYELKRIMPDVPIILFTLHADTMMYALGPSSPIDLVVAKSDAVHIVDHIRSLIPV